MKRRLFSLLLAGMLALGQAALAAEPVTLYSEGRFSGLALADDGLLATDLWNKVIWRITDGEPRLYAGRISIADLSGEPVGGYSDAALTDALFFTPWAIAPYGGGYAVTDSDNNVVRCLTENGVLTIAGSGRAGYSNGTGTGASFRYPTGLAADEEGSLYVADTGNNVIRKISARGTVTTHVTGLLEPTGLCWYDGVLYIADSGHHRICKVENGTMSVLAGGVDGQSPSDGAYEGDYINGSVEIARFSAPQGIAAAADGTLYVADTGNGAVRAIAAGQVSTLVAPAAGQDTAWPVSPRSLLIKDDGLYIADTFAGVLHVDLAERTLSFPDVSEDSWYAEAAAYAARAGILKGAGNGLFQPSAPLDRAMSVTMLSRMYGSMYPNIIITGETVFSDVMPEAWYADAIAWAAGHQITGGVGGCGFDPLRAVTRQELALLLWRYARLLDMDRTVGGDVLAGFPDALLADPWAVEAVSWAVDRKILQGNEVGLLNPLAPVTRAQAAQMVFNFCTASP